MSGRTRFAKGTLLIHAVALTAGLACHIHPSAAAITFSDFADKISDGSSVVDLQTNGTAQAPSVAGQGPANSLMLIPDTMPSQSGSAFYLIRQFVRDGFDTTFTFNLSNKSTPGEGFAFILQNSAQGPAGRGGSAGNIGYDGIANSLVIEFDTHTDPSLGDPTIGGDQAQISVHAGGVGGASPSELSRVGGFAIVGGTGNGTVGGTDPTNGSNHTLRISYVVNPGANDDLLTVAYDGMTALTLAGSSGLDGAFSFPQDANGESWIGFSAANSLNFVGHADIVNWTFVPEPSAITMGLLSLSILCSRRHRSGPALVMKM